MLLNFSSPVVDIEMFIDGVIAGLSKDTFFVFRPVAEKERNCNTFH
jgi:hypothetical protein